MCVFEFIIKYSRIRKTLTINDFYSFSVYIVYLYLDTHYLGVL